jgi:2-hydroxy-3-keto-5-methylthiopentenyl-1-phosphate phosphatase
MEQRVFDWIVFVDFDGTITSEETLSGALRLLQPEGLQELMDDMMARKLTISRGIQLLFSRLPSGRMGEIEAYIRLVPLRKGFGEFLEYFHAAGVPVVVISGGLKPMMDIKLDRYRDLLLAVHSVELDLSGPMMKLISPYDDGNELMSKTLVMKEYPYKRAICVGDGFTDFNMAKKASFVFARDHLAEFMRQSGLPYYEWNDFTDIVQITRDKIFHA